MSLIGVMLLTNSFNHIYCTLIIQTKIIHDTSASIIFLPSKLSTLTSVSHLDALVMKVIPTKASSSHCRYSSLSLLRISFASSCLAVLLRLVILLEQHSQEQSTGTKRIDKNCLLCNALRPSRRKGALTTGFVIPHHLTLALQGRS